MICQHAHTGRVLFAQQSGFSVLAAHNSECVCNIHVVQRYVHASIRHVKSKLLGNTTPAWLAYIGGGVLVHTTQQLVPLLQPSCM